MKARLRSLWRSAKSVAEYSGREDRSLSATIRIAARLTGASALTHLASAPQVAQISKQPVGDCGAGSGAHSKLSETSRLQVSGLRAL
jgi:hypothetical protein